MRRCQARWTLAATAALLFAAPSAMAAAYTYQAAAAGGSWYDAAGFLGNTNFGQVFPTSDGSKYNFVTCVGPDANSPCTFDPGFAEPDTWYKLPVLPTSAAAQAWTPDYGVLKARAWSTGTTGSPSSGLPYSVYGAVAESGWVDAITTTSAAPVVITFVFTLHGSWNDDGTFVFLAGRPGTYDPDVGGSTPMDGRTWTNCVNCGPFGYDTGTARTLLPGGANGSTAITVFLPFTVNPASFGYPEDPNPYTNPFEAQLSAQAGYNDSEVEAYSTVTLQTILVPPNAGLSFASGHAYSVTVVPEPATWALWAFGLAALLTARRRFS